MNEVFECFMAHRFRDHPHTKERRLRWFRSISEFCQQHGIDLRHITRDDIEKYHRALQWTTGPRGVFSGNTVHQALGMLRAFLRWAFVQGFLGAQDPTLNWLLGKSPVAEKRLLSRAQLESVLNETTRIHHVGLRDCAILHVFAELGLYAQVCVRLDLADLDMARYRLDKFQMGPNLVEHMQRYLKNGRPALLTDPNEKALFLTRSGLRMRQQTFVKLASARGITARLLHRSWRAHREAILDRRLTDS